MSPPFTTLSSRICTFGHIASIRPASRGMPSFADASTWADEVRAKMRETASWHYVDVPLDWPRYDPKFSGTTVSCVVDKINEFKLVIKDKSKPMKNSNSN